ncbi:MAG: FAD:protein FMN transferase [Lapillicoccus sp.]
MAADVRAPRTSAPAGLRRTTPDRPGEPVTEARHWRALGTYVDLQVADPELLDPAAELSRQVLTTVDETCSRFRPDSDLSRANATAGHPVSVSPVLIGALRVALEAAEVTSGIVDPTLGEILVAAGYDRTFASLVPGREPAALPVPVRRDLWREVIIDGLTVSVPRGASLDLGATGKAYAADLVASVVVAELGTPVVVSVGGDVRVAAPVGRDTSWPVAVDHTAAHHRDGTGTPQTVIMDAGGLATSSMAARRWVQGGREWHHLVDPRTGSPATGPWRSVSATGHTCVAANSASTAAIVLGDAAYAWLTEHHICARLVDSQGRVVTTGGWPEEAASRHPGAPAGGERP